MPIGLMRYGGIATDDMQNFVLIIYKASHLILILANKRVILNQR